MIYSEILNETELTRPITSISYNDIEKAIYGVYGVAKEAFKVSDEGAIVFNGQIDNGVFAFDLLCINEVGFYMKRGGTYFSHRGSDGSVIFEQSVSPSIGYPPLKYNKGKSMFYTLGGGYGTFHEYDNLTSTWNKIFDLGFANPFGVATSNNFNGDYYGFRTGIGIVKIDSSYSVSTIFSTAIAGNARGLLVDINNNYLYTIGTSDKKLYKIDLSDNSYSVLAALDYLPSNDNCMYMDSSGLIYVFYGTESNTIQTIDREGNVDDYATAPSPYFPIEVGGKICHLSLDSTENFNRNIWVMEGGTPPIVHNFCIKGYAKVGDTPAKNALIGLVNQNLMQVQKTIETEADGSFSFEDLIEGQKYHLFIQYEDSEGQFFNSKSFYNIEPVDFPVEL